MNTLLSMWTKRSFRFCLVMSCMLFFGIFSTNVHAQGTVVDIEDVSREAVSLQLKEQPWAQELKNTISKIPKWSDFVYILVEWYLEVKPEKELNRSKG